eukprot:gene16094-7447_t
MSFAHRSLRGLKVVRKFFRDSYSKLGMLRTLLPNVNMLALTATADKDLEKKIEELGREAFDILSREKSTSNMLIGMYHKMTLHENKEWVLAQLSDVDGSCRVVVAITSLVMSVDISDLRYVIHYGAPYEVIDYIQGIGRAGRDGAAATERVCQKFQSKEKCELYPSQRSANVTSFFDKQFFVGISKSITKELQGHLPFITSIDYILSQTPIYKEHHAGEIVLIVHDIFGDITDIEVSKAQNAARDRNEEVQSLSLPEWLFCPKSDADSTSGSDKSDLSDGIEALDAKDDSRYYSP